MKYVPICVTAEIGMFLKVNIKSRSSLIYVYWDGNFMHMKFVNK